MRYIILSLIFLFIYPEDILSVPEVSKNVTKKELELKECDFYPEVSAMILQHTGNSWYDLGADKGLCRYQKEYFRIKIFTDAGKEYATVKLQIYSPESSARESGDQLSEIKATTYNLENGEIMKTKMEKSAIYYTRLNKYTQEVSFVLPNVQNGSVIEYSFTRKTGRLTDIDDWYFQYPIPVLHSELILSIPEFLVFQYNMQGSILPIETSKEVNTSPQGFRVTQTTFTAEKIPPVEDEPFVANPCDLPFRLKSCLVAIDFPHMPYESISETYEKFNKKLWELESLGRAIQRCSFADEITNLSDTMAYLTKADSIFSWIKKHISWNRNIGITQSQSFRKTLNEGKGTAADINLALTAAFRAKGLEAYPVILSLRGRGAIHPVYPNIKDFNYLISALIVDNRILLYDATEDLPSGLIPARCLNYSGWLIAENGQFVNLRNKGSLKSITSIRIDMTDDSVRAQIISKDTEYAAVQIRNEFTEIGAEKMQEKILSGLKDWEVSGFGLENKKELFTTRFCLKQNREANQPLYLRPFLCGLPSEPLFKHDKRQAIIDFPHPILSIVMCRINLPEGYVAELPESETFKLEDKDALFSLMINQNPNELLLTAQCRLSTQTYDHTQYPELKVFWEKVADIAGKIVVIKKANP